MNQQGDGESFIEVPGELGAPGTVLRFAALFHTGHGATHYDFLLEVPGKSQVMTWHVALAPDQWPGASSSQLKAERIQGHRAVYMTYEGPVAGGRGEVKRVAAGTATVVMETTAFVKLHLVVEGVDCELMLPL
jgi:hypothetical protein